MPLTPLHCQSSPMAPAPARRNLPSAFLAGETGGLCPPEVQELGERVRALQASMVTVCAWTRKIEYEGRWVPFEEFLLRALNIRASHGMSPEIFDRFMEAIRADSEAANSARQR